MPVREFRCTVCGWTFQLTDMRKHPGWHGGRCLGKIEMVSGPPYTPRTPKRKKKEMTDGKDCTCHAEGSCECGCGADWTPQELIDARAEIKKLKEQLAEKEMCPNCGFNYSDLADVADMADFAGEVESDIHHKGET